MKILYLFLAPFLVSCTLINTYQSSINSGFQYSEIKINENTYDLEFKNLPSHLLKSFFLYRCSKIALSQGYFYFTLQENGLTLETYHETIKGNVNEKGEINATSTGKATNINSKIVKIFKDKPTDHHEIVYNATEVKNSLESFIQKNTMYTLR